MAEVGWVKLTVDMFDNRKIKYLRKLPDGDKLVLIWVMLLTMAGRCNAGGMIFITENVPYTSKSLADELGFEENTVKLALEMFAKLEMIIVDEARFCIAGWEEHQNEEALTKIREQNRDRKRRQRERQLLLTESRDSHVTVTRDNRESHATDIEKEIDIDKEIEIKDKSEKPKRKRFVPPTVEEVAEYCKLRNNGVNAERFVAYYGQKGWMVGRNKMTDWKKAVITWELKDKEEGNNNGTRNNAQQRGMASAGGKGNGKSWGLSYD